MRWKQARDAGVAFEDGGETALDHDGDAEVRARALEELESGSGENAVSQGAKTNHGHLRARRQALQ
jgi:hypothetical protein